MELPSKKPVKITLAEINPYLTCYLCRGYLIDATTISECLHSFCRSCIIKFLQDNSYCPVCEVIINKAKPNLKLDKTLQDVVYKLVPELFLEEMTRRKQFYKQYPDVAAKVSPEERGEDTERTIFNPKDCISLSIEYIRDDSTPGAIAVPSTKNGVDKVKNTSALSEDSQESVMKRYLQCPGMCRVEVLKKFVKTKYNVDTCRFYIEILYKRVPLPDHYSLIDIAYIYSWKRNEPMKFFFRITDVNKVTERFDYFNGEAPLDVIPKFVRPTRHNGEKDKTISSSRKRESMTSKKTPSKPKTPSQEIKKDVTKTCDTKPNKIVKHCATDKQSSDDNRLDVFDYHEETKDSSVCDLKTSRLTEQSNNSELSSKANNSSETVKDKSDTAVKDSVEPLKKLSLRPEITERLKQRIQQEKNEAKNSQYTHITLNRTNNMEIITKIQKVSNKDGQPIGLNIIKQTVKKSTKLNKNTPSPKNGSKKVPNKPAEAKKAPQKPPGPCQSTNQLKEVPNLESEEEDEKSKFLKSIELTAKNVVKNIVTKQNEIMKTMAGQKRKNPSPVKNDKGVKKLKIDKKPTTKIIIQPKQPANSLVKTSDCRGDNGLKSLIESCKINIPSSLSITLKETNENTRTPVMMPPVQNYIEILKLPEENTDQTKTDLKELKMEVEAAKSQELSNEDSDKKVDQDLAEIAKSLTEKIPLSTTVSQIIGPKPQSHIPVTPANALSKPTTIQPSPVPELPCKLLSSSKDHLVTVNPRSPQTFQKIFEESIKKPETGAQKDGQKVALDLTNETSPNQSPSKRNILEIATKLHKKTRISKEEEEEDSKVPVGKVPIPRLPNPRKPSEGETVTNLHSSSLGINYTVSIGGNNPSGSPKTNGIVSPIKTTTDSSISPVKSPDKTVKILSDIKLSLQMPQRHSPHGHQKHSPQMQQKHSPQMQQKHSPQMQQKHSPQTKFLPSEIGSKESTEKKQDEKASEPNERTVPPWFSPRIPDLKYANSGGQSPKPNFFSKSMSSCNSPKHSPKSSPVVKHMYAPSMDQLRLYASPQNMSSPRNNIPKLSPQSLHSPINLPKSSPQDKASPNNLPKNSPQYTHSRSNSPRINIPKTSPSPQNSYSPRNNIPKTSVKPTSTVPNGSSQLNSNQLLEKYNIPNLAQVTASLNFNPMNYGMNSTQLAAWQHAMLLKHIDMNRQNWINLNQGPLLQYEKYLQTLNAGQNP